MGNGPLTGVKVLDMTQYESGTVCTESLAWMGAEVVKVERPVKGEASRHSNADPVNDSYGFCILNMNKKSITCNMKSPEGLALIKELVKHSDVLVENLAPGAVDRLGLGYDVCKELNPKLIFASIKGFASDGPYANYPAFDPIASHTGCFVSATGLPEKPIKNAVNIADSGSGMACAMAICAALYQRNVQGVGQKIEVAMQDYMIGMARALWESYYNTGKVPRRVGNGQPQEDVAPSETYPCKPFGINDYVHIYCNRAPGSKDFTNLANAIGRPDLLEDERFATPHSRFVHKDALDPVIAEFCSKHTKQEVMDILAKAKVPAGAMLDVKDISEDPQYTERGLMVEVTHYQRGKLKVPGFAPRMSENHIDYKSAPQLGNANEEIYHGVLGISDDVLKQYKEKQII